jgi:DNA-binding MarR family transcriptional regulator
MPVYLNQDDALALWRDALSASVRGDGPDLSARQMAILLTVFTQPPPHTVRGLSVSLNISKPAISRALDRLGQLGIVRRRRDDYDRRSIEVQRTVKGAVFLSKFADQVSEAGRELDSPTPFEAGTPPPMPHTDGDF